MKINKKVIQNIVVFVVAVIAVLLLRTIVTNCFIDNSNSTTQTPTSASSNKGNDLLLEEVKLVRVVDGDTIIVNSHNEEVRVRMIGVDTPESVNPDDAKNTEEGTEASNFTKSQLQEGQTLYLEYDEEIYDQYKRTLAYVWLSKDVDDENIDDISNYMYNAVLLKTGYAEVMTVEPNDKYELYFDLISKMN